MDKNEIILQDPAPFINIKEHSASSIDILARYYTKSDDYWTAHWYMLEAVKKTFDENGISIPYPQLDVHVKNDLDNISKEKQARRITDSHFLIFQKPTEIRRL